MSIFRNDHFKNSLFHRISTFRVVADVKEIYQKVCLVFVDVLAEVIDVVVKALYF